VPLWGRSLCWVGRGACHNVLGSLLPCSRCSWEAAELGRGRKDLVYEAMEILDAAGLWYLLHINARAGGNVTKRTRPAGWKANQPEGMPQVARPAAGSRSDKLQIIVGLQPCQGRWRFHQRLRSRRSASYHVSGISVRHASCSPGSCSPLLSSCAQRAESRRRSQRPTSMRHPECV
jgi:hypothetical protein